MSKFLKIFAPALGGTGAVLTLAYVMADQFIVDIPAPVRGQLVQPAMAQDAPVEDAAVEDPIVEDALATAEAAGDVQTMEIAALNAPEGGFGLGRPATEDEVAAWDIDVRPDGMGLPEGSGDVWTGEEVFVEKCAACHGDFGEAVGRWPVLAGGQGTLQRADPVKTIGSYWPYLSTVYDYVNRAMPFGYSQSLEPDEIYAITAYLLYVNDMVDDDFELSHENFTEISMPNVDNFYLDDRAETELPLFSAEPCMTDCKDSAEITMHASVLDVTPDDATDDAPVEEAAVVEEEAPTPDEVAATDAATSEDTPVAVAVEDPAQDVVMAAADPELVAAGERLFRQCTSCHTIGEGARNGAGPHLNGVVGRVMGSVDGFRYSRGFQDAAAEGRIWDDAELHGYLADPRAYMNGTRMSFRGFSSQEDLDAIVAYLGTLEE